MEVVHDPGSTIYEVDASIRSRKRRNFWCRCLGWQSAMIVPSKTQIQQIKKRRLGAAPKGNSLVSQLYVRAGYL
jgi:hypothetical protein